MALFLLPTPIFVIAGLLLPFSEEYTFDKGQDMYCCKQRRALKNSVTREGLSSQVRAVQVERKLLPANEDHETEETFRAVLLLQQGMLFGTPPTVLLREDTSFDRSHEQEARIAAAIAKFLDLPAPDTVTI